MSDFNASTVAAKDSTEPLIQIHIPAEVDRIKLVRPGVDAAARMCGLSQPVARDVVLAVDEACQNIIVHGYKGQSGGEIDITLSRHEDGVLAELRDKAPRIDPEKVRHRDLTDLKPGKLGTYFMSMIMDRIEYLSAPGGGNLLRMFKRKDQDL